MCINVPQVNAKVGMKGLRKYAPKKYVKRLELLAETTNLPRIGIHDNCAFPTMQLNIAPAISRDGCESMSFIACITFAILTLL